MAVSKKRVSLLSVSVVILAVAVFGASVVSLTKAAPTAVVTTNGPSFGFYTNPQSAKVSSGTKIYVKVYANLSSYSAEGISALVHYDTNLLHNA